MFFGNNRVKAPMLIPTMITLTGPDDRTDIAALASFAASRPEVEIAGRATRVLVEQTSAVDPSRLGDHVGRLTFPELRQVEAALRLVLEL